MSGSLSRAEEITSEVRRLVLTCRAMEAQLQQSIPKKTHEEVVSKMQATIDELDGELTRIRGELQNTKGITETINALGAQIVAQKEMLELQGQNLTNQGQVIEAQNKTIESLTTRLSEQTIPVAMYNEALSRANAAEDKASQCVPKADYESLQTKVSELTESLNSMVPRSELDSLRTDVSQNYVPKGIFDQVQTALSNSVPKEELQASQSKIQEIESKFSTYISSEQLSAAQSRITELESKLNESVPKILYDELNSKMTQNVPAQSPIAEVVSENDASNVVPPVESATVSEIPAIEEPQKMEPEVTTAPVVVPASLISEASSGTQESQPVAEQATQFQPSVVSENVQSQVISTDTTPSTATPVEVQTTFESVRTIPEQSLAAPVSVTAPPIEVAQVAEASTTESTPQVVVDSPVIETQVTTPQDITVEQSASRDTETSIEIDQQESVTESCIETSQQPIETVSPVEKSTISATPSSEVMVETCVAATEIQVEAPAISESTATEQTANTAFTINESITAGETAVVTPAINESAPLEPLVTDVVPAEAQKIEISVTVESQTATPEVLSGIESTPQEQITSDTEAKPESVTEQVPIVASPQSDTVVAESNPIEAPQVAPANELSKVEPVLSNEPSQAKGAQTEAVQIETVAPEVAMTTDVTSQAAEANLESATSAPAAEQPPNTQEVAPRQASETAEVQTLLQTPAEIISAPAAEVAPSEQQSEIQAAGVADSSVPDIQAPVPESMTVQAGTTAANGTIESSQTGQVLEMVTPVPQTENVVVEETTKPEIREVQSQLSELKGEENTVNTTTVQAPKVVDYYLGFIFRNTGFCARSGLEFVQAVERIPVDILQNHLKNGDFETWFEEVLEDNETAASMKAIRESGIEGEGMRLKILCVVSPKYKH